jgi:DNA polymerase III delta prime subunit
MNNNDNSRYLSKTKLRKFNKIIKKANQNDEEYIFYYNFKHIKIFLFQNESNYKVLKENLTQKSDLNTYLNEQDIILRFVKKTFLLNTHQIELEKLHLNYKQMIRLHENIKTKNEAEKYLTYYFNSTIKLNDRLNKYTRDINENDKKDETFKIKHKDEIKYYKSNLSETRNEMFVAELKNVLKSRNIKSNIN